MGISETTLQLVCEYLDKQIEPVTCREVGAAVGRATVTAREALAILEKRGLVRKGKVPASQVCGVTLTYRRTEMPYVKVDLIGKAHDFSELLKVWKVRPCKRWNGPYRTHECADDSLGFGEFADGTCL